mgnify:CR=1 FL=1
MLHILAAFIFFTRLPFWRLAEVPSEYFKNVVSRWALVGWLTAGFSVIVLYAGFTGPADKCCRVIGNRHPPADNR